MPRLSKIGAAALAAFGWTTGGASVSASYLVVAGGAGGGGNAGGGGGAGGYRTGTASLNPTLSYTVTVGGGGASGGIASTGSSGSNSVFSSITSTGGGGGGGGNFGGVAGGSGGGSGADTAAGGGAGTGGQGNNGGASGSVLGGGGGGGASAVGVTATNTNGANGGDGTSSSISGSSVTYAGGGGGGGRTGGSSGGSGGSGGGGAGSGNGVASVAGTANTGGGGGAGYAVGVTPSAAGGSGIVIISYVGAQQFSGGVVTSSGGNTIHTFNTSGTLGPVTPLSANYLVVAGGGSGGGGYAGGGGAGGLLTGSGLTIDPYSTYVVTVGAGGAIITSLNVRGTQGSNSAFSMVATAAVGGGGGAGNNAGQTATSGGSGGGGAYPPNVTGGAATSGQGFAGGTATGTGGYFGAGGGGAGAVGATGSGTSTPSSTGGNGGIGVASSISGTSTYYAGGGGGGTYHTAGLPGSGGLGGGGAGSETTNVPGTSGTANTGGGGGGGCDDVSGYGGAGGSGVVIISYAGSTQLMAGGVVTIAGGNVIHTFNSSGYLTPLTLLTRSLRFRSSASASLTRTPATATNRKTFTWSGWVKRGTLSTYQTLFSATTGGYPFILRFDNDNTIFVYQDGTSDYGGSTSAVYRDPSAWYHIVLAMDTTQATDTNRLKLYVNGVQNSVSAFYGYFALNVDTSINSTGVHAIGQSGSANYYDGYLAEVNFIDGQALAPTAFGTFNSYGVWQPITYGGSYGTNGFRLPFTNNASTTTLGYDFSPQGNNWTTNNISVTAGATYDSMTDVPTLTSATAANYCTLNPLSTTIALSDGNLNVASLGNGYVFTTQQITTGKWYWEFTTNGGSNYNYFVGVISTDLASYTYLGMCNGGNSPNIFATGKSTNGTLTQPTGSRPAQPATIGVKLDVAGGSVEFVINGTVNGSITGITNWPTGQFLFPFFSNYTSTFGYQPLSANFGQQPFVNALPSGYLPLNTYNL